MLRTGEEASDFKAHPRGKVDVGGHRAQRQRGAVNLPRRQFPARAEGAKKACQEGSTRI